jgi:DNA-binding NtrC family response regulator
MKRFRSRHHYHAERYLLLSRPSGSESLPAALLLGGPSTLRFGIKDLHAIDWESLELSELGQRDEPVVIAISNPAIPNSVEFFSRLGSHKQLVLALVDAQDSETLAAATAHADDFALWPADPAEIAHRVERLMRIATPPGPTMHERPADDAALTQLAGEDPRFLAAIRQIPLFARSEMPVLIAGETGTGKELTARALHFLSARRNEPFIAVDCSAIPDHLFENELFGHARGAYTDAQGEQKGLATLAGRGTLFLDEIDSLSTAAQGKLLRFLQEKSYKPLGAEKFMHAHATVLTATNRDLEMAVREKRFRSDLYYRINVLQLRLPALRDRPDDIPLLARRFLQGVKLTPAALRKLIAYDWPGNVRELWNIIQRASVNAEGGLVLPCHIDIPSRFEDSELENFRAARGRAIQSFERAYLQEALERHNGNISRAARAVGQERRAFGRLVKKHKLTTCSA